MARPRKVRIDEKTLAQIEEWAAMGLNHQQMMALLGLVDEQWADYRRKFREIDRAIARGRSRGLVSSSTALLKRVNAGTVDAIKWYETTRYGMGERMIHDVNVEMMDAETMRAKIAEMLSTLIPDDVSVAKKDTKPTKPVEDPENPDYDSASDAS